MKNNFSLKALNNIVLIGIILTLVSLLGMPLVLTAIFKSGFGIIGTNMPMNISIAIYIATIPYIVALFLMKKICKLIAMKNQFSRDIPRYLNQISICAFSEILLFNAIQLTLYYCFDIYLYGITIILAIIVSFVSLSIGFLSIVLGKLFKIAIEIKEENDKTI